MKWWLLSLVGVFSGHAHAQDLPPIFTPPETENRKPTAPNPTRIDPTFALLQHHVRMFGHHAPIFGTGLAQDLDLTGTGALLKFRAMPSDRDLRELQALGVHLQKSRNKHLHIGRIYSVWVPFAALPGLSQMLQIERVEASWTPILLAPLEVTTAEVGANDVRQLPDLGFDGNGVLIADIDSGIDPTHPHFFFADGGRFHWLDANQDRRFTPGVDGLDLNQDGQLSANEFLRILDAGAVHDGQVENTDDAFQPHRDWLYIDANQNQQRDAGRDAGFTSEDPALGEPLFVVEDITQNNQLDPGEPLYRLGTSKIRAIVTPDAEFTRNTSLLDVTATPDFSFVFHGTGVASILLGGQAPHDRRGVAPGAELLAYPVLADFSTRQNFDASRHFEAMADALDRGTHIILHEWTDAFRAPHDGSSLLEEAMATARNDHNVLHVTPTGNLHASRKHTSKDTTDGQAELPFEVATPAPMLLFGSLMWQGPAASVHVVTPDNTTFALTPDQATALAPGQFAQITTQTTSRGFQHLQFFVWGEQPLSTGTWSLNIHEAGQTTVFGRITDASSGWAPGTVQWQNPTQTATLTFPSTADAAFAVAAHGGRWAMPRDGSQPGQLRGFSGQGPRFDGVLGVDLSAPDDPFAALPATPEFLENGYERGWLSTFGGTSGAAPHVAGALALLRQAFPDESPEQLENRLTQNARNQDLDPSLGNTFPNPASGWGALDIPAALGATRPPSTNRPPTVELVIQTFANDANAQLVATADDPDGDPVEVRFDIDHDGTFDTPFGPSSDWTGPRPDAQFARIEARDIYGASTSALAAWTADNSEPDAGHDTGLDAGHDTGLDAGPHPPPQDCEGCSAGHSAGSWLALLSLWLTRPRRRRA